MKITRSSKLHFSKWLTTTKRNKIESFLSEYSRVVNYFITTYERSVPDNSKYTFLSKEYLDKCESWLSSRAKQDAFAEGYGMLKGALESAKQTGRSYVTPVHYGKKALLSSKLNKQSDSVGTKLFDFNVKLSCLGNKIRVSVPLKKHRRFNHWNYIGKRSKSIVLTNKYIVFSFEIDTGIKKTTGSNLGIDLGINQLATCSDGLVLGQEYKDLMVKLFNKQQGSKSWLRTKDEIRSYIDSQIKNIPLSTLKLVVVENLKRLKYKMRVHRRMNKKNRRFIATWTYRYILRRIEMLCEENRVSFRSVPAYNTSITCSCCGHSDKRNRQTQELFTCRSCGYSDNADLNASVNILGRFITGKYGSGYKT